jgi:hypothetical protein
MDSGSTIHGIPQWEHPKQIGCGDKAVDVAPPFSPQRSGKLMSQQLLPPRTPTTVSTTSQSQQKSSSEQAKRSSPMTGMDHRALLKMDGISPDRMLIAFDSDSHSCCPSVGDITWDLSEAMAFQQSSMDKRSIKPQQRQHPWQNFTEFQSKSPQEVSKDRPFSTTFSRPNRSTDPSSSPRKSKNQLKAYGNTNVSKVAQKHQHSNEPTTERTSRSRTTTRRDNRSHEAMTVLADITSPPKTPTLKSPHRKKCEHNEIDLSFNFGSGSASEKCPDEVNLAALFSRKKELSRKGNIPKKPHVVSQGGLVTVTPAPPTSSRPKSRPKGRHLSKNAPPRQEPAKMRPTHEIHFESIDRQSSISSGSANPTCNIASDAVRSTVASHQSESLGRLNTDSTKRTGTRTGSTDMNRLHFGDQGINGNSWKKLNCSKSSLHSSSKHIEESIQSLETTLFGSSTKNESSMLSDANETVVRHDDNMDHRNGEDDDDYDIVNEIVDDYIDFDTAMAMTSAIMEN